MTEHEMAGWHHRLNGHGFEWTLEVGDGQGGLGCCGNDLPASAGNKIPGQGRSPVEGNGNLLQYSCLEDPMDRGAWQSTVHGVTKSWT